MKKFLVANSYPRGGAPKWRLVGARDADSMDFTYGPTQPSEEGTCLGTETRGGVAGDPEQEDPPDEEMYSVRATGVVDDFAMVQIGDRAGQSAGPGDDVTIDMDFGTFPAGYYDVSVTQKNSSNEVPGDNESKLECTIHGLREGYPEPEKQEDCECGGDTCENSSDGDTPSGGSEESARMARMGERTLHFESYKTTSGGTGVSRSSDAWRMSWSAIFGTFRGLAQMPTGRLQIGVQGGYHAGLHHPSGLSWNHPLGAWLALPERGIARNRMVALHQGQSILNYMIDGTGAKMFSVAHTKKSTTILEFVTDISRGSAVVCRINEARYIRASFSGGAASFFDKEDGRCVGYISAGNLEMGSERGE